MAFTIASPLNSTKEISQSYYTHFPSESGSPPAKLFEFIDSYALILGSYSKPDAHDVSLSSLESPSRLLRLVDL